MVKKHRGLTPCCYTGRYENLRYQPLRYNLKTYKEAFFCLSCARLITEETFIEAGGTEKDFYKIIDKLRK